MSRTHHCGALRAKDVGSKVTLMGWVNTRRDHGGLIFIDLRDRYGITQVVADPKSPGLESATQMRSEFVISVEGSVRGRPAGMNNSKIPTGEVEVVAEKLTILSEAEVLPFDPADPQVNEMLRLKYRYLDLRSPTLQKNMIMRSEFCHIVRNIFREEGFLEVETPILWKSTPEGARDYLVPSRVSPGNFFALPQSPQTLKQLLMISGFDRYYQIARCFRDEDLRADRQPEFTQVDVEMSFVEPKDVMGVTEKAVKNIWKQVKSVDLQTPFPIMTYQDAMDRYGNDKPDVRFGMEIKDLAGLLKTTGFKVFDDVVARGGVIRGIPVPKGASLSRKDIDDLTEMAKRNDAKGLVWIKWEPGEKLSSPVNKFFDANKLKEMCKAVGAGEGDAAIIVADEFANACKALSALRLFLGAKFKVIDTTKDKFLWVVDFPLLDYDPIENRWIACHHPFTSPLNEDIEKLVKGDDAQLKQLKAKAYDLVCNGYEVAGGSIRIHQKQVQEAMFRALKISAEEAQLKFGFFLDALKYGTPPHGGIAWGVDRLIMILCGTDAIRDVIAFPKTQKAACPMSGTPSQVNVEQLAELGVRLVVKADK